MTVDTALARELAPTGTLRVALNMGNKVLALSKTSSEKPAGVTIDIARHFARTFGFKAIELLEFATPAESLASMGEGRADIGFLARDPKRANAVHFTQPYLQIGGSYVVPRDSAISVNSDVDRAGTRIVVGVGSAYELYLSRTLTTAKLVMVPKSEDVVPALLADRYEVGAGVRQAMEAEAARHPEVRLLDGYFMTIEQCMGMQLSRSERAREALDGFVAGLRQSGFVGDALKRHGIEGATAL